MTTYLVIKQENRPNGITNKTTESRQTFASAMSLFYSWASTASTTELFTSVVLTILDNNANIIENKIITTSYQEEPVEPVEPEEPEEPVEPVEPEEQTEQE